MMVGGFGRLRGTGSGRNRQSLLKGVDNGVGGVGKRAVPVENNEFGFHGFPFRRP